MANVTGAPMATTKYRRPIKWDVAIIGVLVVIFAISTFIDPNFGSAFNISFLIANLTEILIIAMPMTLLIISGEIDLSVASVIGLSGAVFGVAYREGLPIEIALVLAIVAGMLCGLTNGLLVAKLGLGSLAVTIATLSFSRIGRPSVGSESGWPGCGPRRNRIRFGPPVPKAFGNTGASAALGESRVVDFNRKTGRQRVPGRRDRIDRPRRRALALRRRRHGSPRSRPPLGGDAARPDRSLAEESRPDRGSHPALADRDGSAVGTRTHPDLQRRLPPGDGRQVPSRAGPADPGVLAGSLGVHSAGLRGGAAGRGELVPEQKAHPGAQRRR